MKKKFAFLVLSLVLSAILMVPVQGQYVVGEMVFRGWGTSGYAVVEAPDHPLLMVEAVDFRCSTFGRIDFLMIAVWDSRMEDFMPWVAVTDNPRFAALMEDLFGEIPFSSVVLVNRRALEVYSRCRFVCARLRVPIEVPIGVPIEVPNGAAIGVPIENVIPEGVLVIHPFTLRICGRGCGVFEEGTEPINGYTLSFRMIAYEARATIFGPDCPGWEAVEAVVGRCFNLVVWSHPVDFNG